MFEYVAREVVIGPVLDDELHLVVGRETIEVLPVVAMRFTAARTFDVDDLDYVARYPLDGSVTAGLEQHSAPRREQVIHQRVHIILEEWLTAGDLDQIALKVIDV